MLPADYHMHTPLCRHAEGAPVQYARQAVALGLPEIGFSDHSPMPAYLDNWRMLDEEFPRYLEWVEEARAALPQLPIRLGLEIDYLVHGEEWIDVLAKRADWDYLIGSVHYLGDWAVDDPSLVRRFSEQSVEAVWDRYWLLFQQAARSRFFDILAHADLVKKFGHRPGGDLRRYYEPAIQAVLDAHAVIEINTAGLFKEVGEMYPAPTFLKMAASAGVPLIISSDAHRPEDVGRAFPEAVRLAADAGFLQLQRFERRRRTAVPLT